MTPLNLEALTFPLHGSRLIEASAGTGKTFTIALLYVRLVLGHGGESAFQRPLNPPEILVVTFTDAATQELRDRIRLRLSEAAHCFGEPLKKHDSLLELLRADYPADQWPECARRLQLAGEWMDEAAVSTIHGWCYRMLREHAFDSGSLFTQTLETNQSELLAEVVRDYWRRHYYGLSISEAKVIAEYFKGPKTLGEALSSLLARRDANFMHGGKDLPAPGALRVLLKAPADWNASASTLEHAARSAWRKDRQAIETLLQGMRGKFNGNSYRKVKEDPVFNGWLAALEHWSLGQEAPKNLSKFGQTRFVLTGGAQPSQHEAFQAIDALIDHQAAKQNIRAQLLLHALAEISERFDTEKLRRAEIGFDDLLNRLDAALQGPSGERLATIIREQYPIALIDEFQDTDPVQYRIFETVYRISESAEDSGLFMIGDPKQAIYAFRGADIYTYLRAREATSGRHYTLGTNYRSTEAMVTATNRCFEFAEGHERAAFRFAKKGLSNPVPFHRVDAKGREDYLEVGGQRQTALTLWSLAGEGDMVNADTYRRGMADAAASAIQAWLEPSGPQQAGLRQHDGRFTSLRPADIAILVRNRTEAEVIRKSLAQRNLASVYLSDRDSVFDSEEARDLLYVLRACAEPSVDRLLRAALATRSIGLDWQALERLNHNELHWEEQVQSFREYRQLWKQQGVLPMLRRLLADFKVPARLLRETGGERSLTNLLHLAEWLQRSATELDGENALIRHLAEQLQASNEEEILRLESDADLIKVVTVHKSKGLEYPLVLLPFICSATELSGRSKSPPMFHAEDDGELCIDLGKSDVAEEAYEKANDERLSEEMRLLYVALTRARYATWLGIAPLGRSNGKKTDLSKGGLGYLLSGGDEITAAQLDSLLQALKGTCEHIVCEGSPEVTMACYQPPQKPDLGPALRPLHKPASNWWIASYSALSIADGNQLMGAESGPWLEPATAIEANLKEEGQAINDSVDVLPAGPGIHGFPRGAGPGTFLHGLFEWAGKEGFAKVLNKPETIQSTVARRCNLRDWEIWIEPLSGWLTSYLQTPLRFDGNTVSLAELSTYQVEMEFWFSSQLVNVRQLDKLVCEYTLNGQPRPVLAPGQLNGMFKGFIDLTFEHQGRYYVADYKSNWLGRSDESYNPDSMVETMLGKRYDLQSCLYLLALHRQLKLRLRGYDYDRHMGGAVYLFVRGHQSATQGVHFERPPRELIEQMDQLFMGQHTEVAV
ncbi:exodeoxyribonuclease V subunit beta [Pseudomonas sp. TH41]|uniref:exodeoxyribonuclease V subunit beta n=1 Tax=Pseudomonas sp. TH41 TaxID=2796405 RepID=UPI001912EEBB|nr:exodeoxyribonuclease V subunit beta [Pseudomonas sp. TH41]MBK5355426.1 exodeoxyribonuclease V subunit beta [Pseudomonas sp. TH41]